MLSAEQFTTLERKIERFGRILEQKPDDELTVLALAEASFRRGLRLEALTAYQDVVRSRPVPEAHLAVAEIYQAQRMYAEAYEELRRLFSLDPENVEARMLVVALREELSPPEDIEEIMGEPTSERAFEEARLRLKIQRTIFNRELQERTRNVTLQPGVVIHEYYVEEAKKRLIQVDEHLRQLERLKELNEELALAPRAQLAPPHLEEPSEVGGEALQVQEAGPQEEHHGESGDDAQTQLVMDDSGAFEEGSTEESLEPLSAGEASGDPLAGAADSLEEPGFEEPSPLSDPLEVSHSEGEGEILAGDESRGPVASSDSPEVQHAGLEGTSFEAESLELISVARSDLDPPFAEESSEEPTDSSAYPELDEESSYEFSELSAAEPLQIQSLQAEGDLGSGSHDFEAVHSELSPAPTPEPAPPMIEFDSLISPELPEEGYDVAPPSIELTSPLETAPFDTVPVEQEPPAVPELSEPTMTLPESPQGPVPGPPALTPDPSPPVPEPAAQPDEDTANTVASGGMSAARMAFYEESADALRALMSSSLSRTRGVTSMLLITREGQPIGSVLNDDFDLERLGELVRESFDFLEAFADSPSYWVLECEGGIFVMQRLDRLHVLIAIGQAGANFGALRFTMDKMNGSFGELLGQAPA